MNSRHPSLLLALGTWSVFYLFLSLCVIAATIAISNGPVFAYGPLPSFVHSVSGWTRGFSKKLELAVGVIISNSLPHFSFNFFINSFDHSTGKFCFYSRTVKLMSDLRTSVGWCKEFSIGQ